MRGNYSTHGHATRNQAALFAPLPKLSVRPAHIVLGWTDAQKATFELGRDRNDLAAGEARYASACAALGRANKHRYSRRQLQAQAMRAINSARRVLRQARAALAASLAAAVPFALVA